MRRYKELEQFAMNARAIRVKRGITFERASELLDLDMSGIRRFENGQTKSPSLYMLLAMQDAYDVSIDELLGRKAYESDQFKQFNNLLKENKHLERKIEKAMDIFGQAIGSAMVCGDQKTLSILRNGLSTLQENKS